MGSWLPVRPLLTQIKLWNQLKMILVSKRKNSSFCSLLNHYPITIDIKNKEDRECLHALFVTNPLDDMTRIRQTEDQLLEGTCSWILDNSRYQTFVRDYQAPILWIHGDPGKGKTFLAMSQIHKFTEHIQPPASVDATLLYFFCQNSDNTRDNAVAILRGLLYQLFCQHPSGIRHLRDEYDKQRDQLFRSPNSQQTLWRIFESALREIPHRELWVVVDALDECDPESLEVLLDRIIERSKMHLPERWLFTSRNEPHIRDILRREALDISLEDNHENVERDIRRFINAKVEQLSEKRLTPALRSFVVDTLREKTEDTFLWVSLACKRLRRVRPLKFRLTLERIPAGLTAIYEQILKRALQDEDFCEAVKRILVSMLIAVRPLTLLEVALIADLPEEYREDIDSIQGYAEECGSLVTIRDGRLYFVHPSVKDYLLSTPLLDISHNQEDEHGIVLKRCFRYICSGVFNREATFPHDSSNNPEHEPAENLKESLYKVDQKILEYPTMFWMVHGMHSSSGAEEVLDQNPEFWCPQSDVRDLWLLYYSKEKYLLSTSREKFSVLHLAAYSGILKLAMALALDEDGINQEDTEKNTPLMWAVRNGHSAMAKLLLRKGADINAPGGFYGNALYIASVESHEAIVKLLLDNGANINAHGGFYSNALQAVSVEGNLALVKLLIEKGADVNAQSKQYGSALQAASLYGYWMVVELLLQNGADINAQGGCYGNALQAASVEGHKELVMFLINRGATVNAEGGEYGNALQAASFHGHGTVVGTLLICEANVNLQGGYYGNALQAASFAGHEKLIKQLLGCRANVNARGGHYGNALQAASSAGNEAVAKLLVGNGADVNAQDKECGNALYIASLHGYMAVVKLLLEKGANVNAHGGYYGNALQAASVTGLVVVVKLLLEYGADIHLHGGHHGSALEAASSEGNEAVVELLLEHGIRKVSS
jgi:ankyrin repeat protein